MRPVPAITAQLEALHELKMVGETGDFVRYAFHRNQAATPLSVQEARRVERLYIELFRSEHEPERQQADF